MHFNTCSYSSGKNTSVWFQHHIRGGSIQANASRDMAYDTAMMDRVTGLEWINGLWRFTQGVAGVAGIIIHNCGS